MQVNTCGEVTYLTFPLLEETGMVDHLFSTRLGGVSKGIYSSMNLSYTRGDLKEAVDENFKRISTLCQYVHPEYGVIDHFIASLTGIRNSQVKNAPRMQEALLHMIDWLGEREYRIYAWSESDRDQIVHEIKAKKITDEKILAFVEKENWIDYQAVFTKRYKLTRQLSLEEALERAEIEPEGRFHDGLDDAVNTAYLIEKLELNPEYQLVSYEMPDKPSERLCSTLGDFFTGLNLNFVQN